MKSTEEDRRINFMSVPAFSTEACKEEVHKGRIADHYKIN